ncbi:hypothetical protein PYW08_012919 [Mythimna loreyi]|uniref:Uncharacterized protein n=1 Tax=Mythimna loreyi TaxID=667449 RepID=A0ACC2Q1G3_9NEOP|nr:hypothetical protein PYW08_012919 [Mythimna loreyi]
MAVSEVVAPGGGQGHVKLHPYLITLVRWCVSCLWSSANELLRRLLTTPLPHLPQITAGKPAPRVAKPRAAGSEHLHPEPRVECAVLHKPRHHHLDVIFVHGLYGSLGNTWRQGEWRNKYKLDPTKVPLRNHSSEPCNCTQDKQEQAYDHTQEMYAYQASVNEKVTFEQINGCFKKILPNENSLITEKFYNNTLLDVDVNNFDTQAKFVTEMFKNDCDTNCGVNAFNQCSYDERCAVDCKCKVEEVCKCKASAKGCEAGCGCTCDDCYSHCWPRDWIKEDFPGARVISINYTSDPYLWRPLWVKGTKRLRLHERAEQMMEQLVALGVGQRPIVWVGHSKGGLFIKQIYCDAYEAYLKLDKIKMKQQSILNNNTEDQTDREYIKRKVNISVDNRFNRHTDNEANLMSEEQNGEKCDSLLNNFIKERNNNSCAVNGGTNLRSIDEMKEIRNNNNSGNGSFQDLDNNYDMGEDDGMYYTQDGDVVNKQTRCSEHSDCVDGSGRHGEYRHVQDDDVAVENTEALSSNNEEESGGVSARAALWARSSGFMFYSVPHRGSPLADIKTPLTCRSVELMEIAKDCSLLLELQRRWLAASAAAARPRVRSLVETGRTLMSVLWLRIVSEDSADAGVGVLHGVSVDHREICKPASRRCLLYTELTHLIQSALGGCRCQ